MQTLNAVLAFAITMLVLAMVVTTLVETLHRFLRLREQGLELLLERFYDRVIAARNAGPRDAGMRLAFVQAMSANRAPTGDTRLRRIWAGHRLDELGVQGFMERLGSMPFGASIVSAAAVEGDQALTAALKDISQKFEAFGQEASTYFEARARLVSVIVGIVLAIAVNVNAFTLFDTFMRSPDVTEAVINKLGPVEKQLQDVKPSAAVAGGQAPANEDAKKTQEELKNAQKALKDLKGIGVPIGREGDIRAVIADMQRSLTNGRELLGLLLGGLLIGLGAPFWYRLVEGLVNIRSILGGRSASTSGDAVPPASRAERAVAQPQTPVEAFVASREAANVNSPLHPPEEPVG